MATKIDEQIEGDPSWLEPPCSACLAAQRASDGRETLCATHAEGHVRPHKLSYRSDFDDDSLEAYNPTPERVADDRPEVRDH